MRYHLTKEEPVRLGTRHPSAVPFQAFPTADGWMVLALAWSVPNQWALLCSELDVPELIDDERFHSSAARSRNHAELEPLLRAAFLRRTTSEWVSALEQYGIPCGPLNTIAEAAAMEQVAERQMLPEVPHKTFGPVRLSNSPLKLSRTPAGIRGTSPDMGEHSREVLGEVLGLDAGALDDLVARQVVWEERPEVALG